MPKWHKSIGDLVSKAQRRGSTQTETSKLETEREPDFGRKFCFEYPEEKRMRRNRKQGLTNQITEVEIDINDVTDKDDDDIADSISSLVACVLNSIYFKGMIFIVIAINAVHIALQTVESISIPYSYVFFLVDNFIMGIFICEIVLKWYSGFVIFWKDYWNILDFVIIFVLHLGPWLAFFSNTRLLRILRVIRAFRSLKTVTSLTGLSLVVETILQSIPDMANIILLLFIFMVVLSVVGVKLFGKYVPQYFGDPIKCMFSIFVCFTQDGWMQIFRNFERYAEDDLFTYVCACLFFILTILMAAFIIANLIVAVVTTNLDRAMKEMKEEQRSKRDSLLVETKPDPHKIHPSREGEQERDEEVPDVPLVLIDKILESAAPVRSSLVDRDAIKPQRPLYKSDLSYLTTDKLEDYYLLLIALDENLKEHMRLRRVISTSVQKIRELNDESSGNTEVMKILKGQTFSLSSYMDTTVSFDRQPNSSHFSEADVEK